MPLNTLGLVAGIAVARREGVDPSQVGRIALPGAIFPNLALGVIIVDQLAKQEAALEASQAQVVTGTATPSPGAGGGATGAVATSSIPDPLPQPTSYPTVVEVAPASTFKVGDVLHARTGDWQGLGTVALKFQWYRGEREIKDATTADYAIQTADRDHYLAVEVCYVGGNGEAVITRSPWQAVGTPTDPPPQP